MHRCTQWKYVKFDAGQSEKEEYKKLHFNTYSINEREALTRDHWWTRGVEYAHIVIV